MRLHPAYIAGFLDADGSIVVRLQPQANRQWAPSIGASVGFYNQDLDVLKDIMETLGCGRLRAVRVGYSGVYKVDFKTRDTVMVLKLVLPYLRIKREVAHIALLALSAPLYKGRFRKVPQDQLEYRLSLVARAQELNQRNGKAFRSKWVNSVDPSEMPDVVSETMPSQAATGTEGETHPFKVLRKV